MVHCRNVTADVTQSSLMAMCQQFGRVVNVVMLRAKNQALIEMDTLDNAEKVCKLCSTAFLFFLSILTLCYDVSQRAIGNAVWSSLILMVDFLLVMETLLLQSVLLLFVSASAAALCTSTILFRAILSKNI